MCFLDARPATKTRQAFNSKVTAEFFFFSADETIVVVAVTDRTERNMNKQFNNLDINRKVLEKQLEAWNTLLYIEKRLRIDMLSKCKETSDVTVASTQQSTKRGCSQYILARRTMQPYIEEDTASQPLI